MTTFTVNHNGTRETLEIPNIRMAVKVIENRKKLGGIIEEVDYIPNESNSIKVKDNTQKKKVKTLLRQSGYIETSTDVFKRNEMMVVVK